MNDTRDGMNLTHPA